MILAICSVCSVYAVKAAVRFAAGYRLEVGHGVIPWGLHNKLAMSPEQHEIWREFSFGWREASGSGEAFAKAPRTKAWRKHGEYISYIRVGGEIL